jgi:hypothetical protein
MSKVIKVTAVAVLALPAIAVAQGTPPASTAAAPVQGKGPTVDGGTTGHSPAAQSASTATASAQKSLAQGLGLHVFPAQQQTKEVQDKDESDCYQWAKQNTGIDPAAPAQPAEEQQPKQKRGGAVKGAAKGALVGSAVGAISGDTGQGAAVGAVTGGAAGAAGQAKANKAAQQKQQQQQQQAAANTKNEFNKAMGACLQGKGYTVN